MITEDYVSFETAKLLREKGMDKSCFKHYVQKNNNDRTSEAVTVCTLQMAMKWLREVHNIFIEITVGESEGKTRYDYDILPINGKFIYWKKLEVLSPTVECNTPEEAIEVGLKYCLKNLI